jgi:hypothetical protein
MKKHLIWNDSDPNYSFEAEGKTFESVLIDALSKLGWSVSEKPIEEEDEEEFPSGECLMEVQHKKDPKLVYLVKGRMTDSDFMLGDYKILTYSTGKKGNPNKVYSTGAFPKKDYNFTLSNKTF